MVTKQEVERDLRQQMVSYDYLRGRERQPDRY
jgi:hypothetical protein